MYFLRQHAAIILVLVAFLGLGVAYSIVNPLFESPDEVWHYEYIRYLTEGHGLPISDLVSQMPWHQEGSQPPLYYLLAAGLTFWVDTGNAEAVIRYNPHATIGLADAADNKNMMVHTGREAFPYRGVVLAAHLARFLSLLTGAATLLCTYLTALAVFPGQKALAAVAAAIVACNPQFIFISTSVNNDNLANLLSCAALWLLVRIWQRGATAGRLISLGLLAGLGSIAKLNGLILLPFLALVLIALARRKRSWRPLIGWGLLVGAPAVVTAGWWYWRNWRLYGDPFGLAAMFAVLPARAQGPDLAELLGRAAGVWRSAWAVFGWFNVVAAPWLYDLYTGLALAGLVGLAVLVYRGLRRGRGGGAQTSEVSANCGSLSALAWLALWAVVVLAALVGWSQKRYPQGRLLFPAISAAAVLLAAGLTQGGAWLRTRWQQAGAGALLIGLCALAAWIPGAYIAPTYAPPPRLASLSPQIAPRQADFGGQVRLLGYDLPERSTQPGQALELTLYWQALTPPERDYSVYVHLVDDNGLILAQRDSYPAGGLEPTGSWLVGPIVQDRHSVQIPVIAPAPAQTRLRIGLYDYRSQVRLLTADGSDYLDLDTVSLVPAESQLGLPNPVYFNFEGKLVLVGFDLDRRAVRPGETLHLTLYWQALAPMQADYVVFVHLLRPPDQVWAQRDQQPQAGRAPTSTWQPGQILEDCYQLDLRQETPPGVYQIEVGLYLPATGDRLRVGLSDQGIVLGQVRVQEP